MKTKTKKKSRATPVNIPTHEQVIELVKTLPPDRLTSVYDFARFVRTHPVTTSLTEDIFGETEEQIRADETEWAQQFADSREKLRAIAREAQVEYREGRTKSMKFSSTGRLVR